MYEPPVAAGRPTAAAAAAAAAASAAVAASAAASETSSSARTEPRRPPFLLALGDNGRFVAVTDNFLNHYVTRLGRKAGGTENFESLAVDLELAALGGGVKKISRGEVNEWMSHYLASSVLPPWRTCPECGLYPLHLIFDGKMNAIPCSQGRNFCCLRRPPWPPAEPQQL